MGAASLSGDCRSIVGLGQSLVKASRYGQLEFAEERQSITAVASLSLIELFKDSNSSALASLVTHSQL